MQQRQHFLAVSERFDCGFYDGARRMQMLTHDIGAGLMVTDDTGPPIQYVR